MEIKEALEEEINSSTVSRERGIIVCKSFSDVEWVNNTFPSHCIGYPKTDNLFEKNEAYSNWKDERDSRKWLVGTSALLMGLDYYCVTTVIFLYGFYDTVDFIQGSGRLARSENNLVGKVLLLTTKQIAESLFMNGLSYGVTNNCLRQVSMSCFEDMDNNPPCFLIPNGQLCDNCSNQSQTITTYVDRNDEMEDAICAKQIKSTYVNQLYDYLNENLTCSLWGNRCFLCFLVGSYSNNAKLVDLSSNHTFDSCMISNGYGPDCSSCLDTGHSCCQTYFCQKVVDNPRFKKIQMDLQQVSTRKCCYKCLLPMKLGDNWIHQESEFGPNCMLPPFPRILATFLPVLVNEPSLCNGRV